MYTLHSVESSRPDQSRLSREAARRYAILSALREGKRARRGLSTRRLMWTPTLQHSR